MSNLISTFATVIDTTDIIMAISNTLLESLKRHEGFVPTWYKPKGEKSAIGWYTIGYGRRRYLGVDDIERVKDFITREQAERYLIDDVTTVMLQLEVVLNTIWQSLSDNRRDALTSFVFNVGIGTFKRSKMCRRLKAGDFEIQDEFLKYVFSGKTRLAGLEKRRAFERKLWLS